MSITIGSYFKATNKAGHTIGFTNKEDALTFAGSEERVAPVESIYIVDSHDELQKILILHKLSFEEATTLNQGDSWKTYFDRNNSLPFNEGPILHAQKLALPIEEFNFSPRVYNALKKNNISTIGDIIKLGSKKLWDIDGMGQKSIIEIEVALHERGYRFDMNDHNSE